MVFAGRANRKTGSLRTYGKRIGTRSRSREFKHTQEITYTGPNLEKLVKRDILGVGRQFAEHLVKKMVGRIYVSMRMRMRQDTGKMRKSLKRQEVIDNTKKKGDVVKTTRIYVHPTQYDQTEQLVKGRDRRTTVHSAFYQETGFEPHYLAPGAADLAGKYDQPRAIFVSKSTKWQKPAIDKWVNNKSWMGNRVDAALADMKTTLNRTGKRTVRLPSAGRIKGSIGARLMGLQGRFARAGF